MNRFRWVAICCFCLPVAVWAQPGEEVPEVELTDPLAPLVEGPIEPAAEPAPGRRVGDGIRALRGLFGGGNAPIAAQPPVKVSPELQATIDEAIRELASEDFHTREMAAQKLLEIGPAA